METIKILVVDDEEEICALTRSFLVKRGYTVFTAETIAAAVDLVKKESPKLALLDVRLAAYLNDLIVQKIYNLSFKERNRVKGEL